MAGQSPFAIVPYRARPTLRIHAKSPRGGDDSSSVHGRRRPARSRESTGSRPHFQTGPQTASHNVASESEAAFALALPFTLMVLALDARLFERALGVLGERVL